MGHEGIIDQQQVAEVIKGLRARGIDVIRVSYPDLIGTDRGRDVLMDELGTVMGHGIAFCRRRLPHDPARRRGAHPGRSRQPACPTSPSCPTSRR